MSPSLYCAFDRALTNSDRKIPSAKVAFFLVKSANAKPVQMVSKTIIEGSPSDRHQIKLLPLVRGARPSTGPT